MWPVVGLFVFELILCCARIDAVVFDLFCMGDLIVLVVLIDLILLT